MNRYLTIPEEDILTDPESAGAVQQGVRLLY